LRVFQLRAQPSIRLAYRSAVVFLASMIAAEWYLYTAKPSCELDLARARLSQAEQIQRARLN